MQFPANDEEKGKTNANAKENEWLRYIFMDGLKLISTPSHLLTIISILIRIR